MKSTVDEDLVRDVSRVVVTRVAPEELPAFRVVSNAYFAGFRRRSDQSDGGLLDFGPGEAVVLVTPVVLAAMSDVVQHLISEFIQKTLAKGGQAAARAVRRLFGIKQADDETPVALTENEWAEVHRIVVEAAQQHGATPEAAARLADAVVEAGRGGETEPQG